MKFQQENQPQPQEIIQMDNEETELNPKSSKNIRHLQAIVDSIVIIVIYCISYLIENFQEPSILYFTCDQDVFYPYKQSTIDHWTFFIFCTLFPVLVIIVIELYNAHLLPYQKESKENPIKSFGTCIFHSLSLFLLGISLTLCLTSIGKNWIGRLRPYFIHVCQPHLNKLNCTSPTLNGHIYNPIYTGGSFCTNEDKEAVKEARMSFPSGHSSYSWYTMLFLIIFIEARLFLLRLRYIKPLIQLCAFSAAFVIMLSRVSDYHHRGSDVIGGTFLGCIVALFVTFVVGKVLWITDNEETIPYNQFGTKTKKSNDYL